MRGKTTRLPRLLTALTGACGLVTAAFQGAAPMPPGALRTCRAGGTVTGEELRSQVVDHRGRAADDAAAPRHVRMGAREVMGRCG